MEPSRTPEANVVWLPRERGERMLAWSTLHLNALASVLGRALAEWRDAWGMAANPSPLRCEAARSEAILREGWSALSAHSAWLNVPADGTARLGQMLFDEDDENRAAGPIACELSEACARDGMRRLAAALCLTDGEPFPSCPPPRLGQPWSGAVQVDLSGTPAWSLLLTAETVLACCRKSLPVHEARPRAAREPLSSVVEALRARPISLRVELSGCELDLGTLQGLQISDVVRLRHELRAPARLTDGAQALFDGFLVAQEGRKAFELAKSPVR